MWEGPLAVLLLVGLSQVNSATNPNILVVTEGHWFDGVYKHAENQTKELYYLAIGNNGFIDSNDDARYKFGIHQDKTGDFEGKWVITYSAWTGTQYEAWSNENQNCSTVPTSGWYVFHWLNSNVSSFRNFSLSLPSDPTLTVEDIMDQQFVVLKDTFYCASFHSVHWESFGPSQICDGRTDCKAGIDEHGCLTLFPNTLIYSLVTTMVLMVVTLLTHRFLSRVLMGENYEKEHQVSQSIREDIDYIFLIVEEKARDMRNHKSMIAAWPKKVGECYQRIHNDERALNIMIRMPFVLFSSIEEKHLMMKLIFLQEDKIHLKTSASLCCIRRNAGNQKEVSVMLESRCRRRLDCLWQCRNMNSQRSISKTSDLLKKMLGVALPLGQVFLFSFDYSKDIWLWTYVISRIDKTGGVLVPLVTLHGFTIIIAPVLMTVLFVKAFHKQIEKLTRAWMALLLLGSPILVLMVPLIIVLRCMEIENKKKEINEEIKTSKQRKTQQRSATDVWIKYCSYEEREKVMRKLYSQLKLVEATAEAVPQMLLLSMYMLLEDSQVYIFDESDENAQTYFELSLFLSVLTILTSIISAINTMKHGQLGLMAKCALGISVFLQIFPRLGLMSMIFYFKIALVEMGWRAEIHRTAAITVLVVSISAHWFCIYILYFKTVPQFRKLTKLDQCIHILSNTWITLPLRSFDDHNQRSKSFEQFWSLILMGINIAVCAAFLHWDVCDEELYGFRFLWYGWFALGCHLLGGIIMILHYRSMHTWSMLIKQKGIKNTLLSWFNLPDAEFKVGTLHKQ